MRGNDRERYEAILAAAKSGAAYRRGYDDGRASETALAAWLYPSKSAES